MNFSLKIKRFMLLILLTITVFVLSGCWDRKEINDLALVTAAGIDKKPEGAIELSVLVFIPKGQSAQQGMEGSSGSGNVQTLMRSAEGTTIADAMSRLQEKLPRHIFWGHCEVFIFDEDLAKDDISHHVDFILRHPQLRERSLLFVSKQKTKKILNLTPPLERDVSEVLRELSLLKIGMVVSTKDFSQMLISESGASALPWIKILPPEEGQEKMQTIAFTNGTAIFKNHKMVGKIGDSVTRGVLWLRDEIELGIITIKDKKAKGYISINILSAKTKLIPKIENGKWKITLQVESENEIIQNTTKLNMADPKVVSPIEKLIKKDIENKVNKALQQVQKEMNADVFGFAEAFHRKYPKVWAIQKQRWDEIFPTIEVKVNADIKIRKQGMNSVLSSIYLEEVSKQ